MKNGPISLAVIVFVALLCACAAPTQKANVMDMDFDAKNVYSNLRITIIRDPSISVLVNFLNKNTIERYTATNAASKEISLAALDVFGQIGSVSEDTTFSPHLIAHIIDASCDADSSFGHYCTSSVDLFWGTGKFIKRYKGKRGEVSCSAFTNACFDSNSYYNSYVKVFGSIAKIILNDEIFYKSFRDGFDDSLSSSAPDIQEIPYLRAKLQRKVNYDKSLEILSAARSRGRLSMDEANSLLQLGPFESIFDMAMEESLLPFLSEIDAALSQGNLKQIQHLIGEWRKWLVVCQVNSSSVVEHIVQKQFSQMENLYHKFREPVLGNLTIKLVQAIKEERWEEAKMIQALIREVTPPKSTIVGTTQNQLPGTFTPSTAVENQQQERDSACANAKANYDAALRNYSEKQRTYASASSNKTGTDLLTTLSKRSSPLSKLVLGYAAQSSVNDAKAELSTAAAQLHHAEAEMSRYCGQ